MQIRTQVLHTEDSLCPHSSRRRSYLRQRAPEWVCNARRRARANVHRLLRRRSFREIRRGSRTHKRGLAIRRSGAILRTFRNRYRSSAKPSYCSGRRKKQNLFHRNLLRMRALKAYFPSMPFYPVRRVPQVRSNCRLLCSVRVRCRKGEAYLRSCNCRGSPDP